LNAIVAPWQASGSAVAEMPNISATARTTAPITLVMNISSNGLNAIAFFIFPRLGGGYGLLRFVLRWQRPVYFDVRLQA
jgi:hypothetical protein